MKDGYKRIIATGLLALMLANTTACDELSELINKIPDDIEIVPPNQSGDGTSVTDKVNQYPNPNLDKVDYLKGGVWAAIKGQYIMAYDTIPDDVRHELEQRPIPHQFLIDEGIIYYNDKNLLQVNGANQPTSTYNPFMSYAFVDNNTKDNEVYLLLQYQSGQVYQNTGNPDVYVGTWLLRYDLDDNDYETFLKLKDDFRIRYFIQEMDKQYEPIVVHKSVIRHDLIALASHVKGTDWHQKGFPNVFVANIDYDNNIITYGGRSSEGLRYFTLNMRKTNNWEKAITRDGLTEEEREDSISIQTMSTPIGECLIDFSINNWNAGLTKEQAEDAFSKSQDRREWEFININSVEKEYYIGK